MISTPRRFTELGIYGKALYLLDNGTYMMSRKLKGFDIHLYNCKGFFVEAWIKHASQHLCWMILVDSEHVADQYLDKINLSDQLGL